MSLEEVEKQYGTRPRIPIGHGEPLLQEHAKGELADGRKFVWCPVGFILSWSPGDYENDWCHWCKIYFTEVQYGGNNN